MSKLLLVDSTNIMFRSHFGHVREPLINSKGVNVSLVYQFVKSLAYLLIEQRPTHVALVFDGPLGSDTRRKVFPAYKTGRSPTPTPIVDNKPVLVHFLQMMGLQTVTQHAYEADDIIGSLAREFTHQNSSSNVAIVSTDKDFMQLLKPQVSILKPIPFGYETVTHTNFPDKFPQLKPEQFVDILSLMGDAADSIPGCKGIGIKTAMKLLQVHGSLDSVFSGIDASMSQAEFGVSDRMRGLLVRDREIVYLSKQLVQLQMDLNIGSILEVADDGVIPAFLQGAPNHDGLHALITTLETPSLVYPLRECGILPILVGDDNWKPRWN